MEQFGVAIRDPRRLAGTLYVFRAFAACQRLSIRKALKSIYLQLGHQLLPRLFGLKRFPVRCFRRKLGYCLRLVIVFG